jgi:chromosome segregation ATPase
MKMAISWVINIALACGVVFFYLRAENATDAQSAIIDLTNQHRAVQAELAKHRAESQELREQLIVLETEKGSLTKQKGTIDKTVIDYQTLASATKSLAVAERAPRGQILQNLMNTEEELVTLKREHQNTVSIVKSLTDQLNALKQTSTTLEARSVLQKLHVELENEQLKATQANLEFMRAHLGRNDLRRDVVALEFEEISIKQSVEKLGSSANTAPPTEATP